MALTSPFEWHHAWRYSHSLFLLLKYPIAFITGWAGIYMQRWRKQRAEASAQSWPVVDGRISYGAVKSVPRTKRFLVTLDYTYFVGDYRFGKYIHEFQSESDADEFLRAMKDKHVPIRYNQSNPDQSVLEQRSIEQHILLAPRFG